MVVGALGHHGRLSSRALVELSGMRVGAIAPGVGVGGHDVSGLECSLVSFDGRCCDLTLRYFAFRLLLISV